MRPLRAGPAVAASGSTAVVYGVNRSQGESMALIDQSETWRPVEARLETETDPTLRRNLEMLLVHMKAEAALDMEPLMATVSEKARYEAFGGGHPPLVGKAAV